MVYKVRQEVSCVLILLTVDDPSWNGSLSLESGWAAWKWNQEGSGEVEYGIEGTEMVTEGFSDAEVAFIVDGIPETGP